MVAMVALAAILAIDKDVGKFEKLLANHTKGERDVGCWNV